MLGTSLATIAMAVSMNTAIVMQDQVAMRSAPKDSARQQAILWSGELVEIRGEKQDYVQVYDYKRERPGYVPVSSIKMLSLEAAEAPELLAAIRYISKLPNNEALTVGLTAAWLQAAPAEMINHAEGAEVFSVLGEQAEKLANRASSQTELSQYMANRQTAYFDVMAGYGIKFNSYERDDKLQICYDGEAFRRVLALPATEQQKATAALALTRAECIDPNLSVTDTRFVNEWQAEVLDKVDESKLMAWQSNQLQLRRASIWGNLAFRRARQQSEEPSKSASLAAERAITALAAVNKEELAEQDWAAYNNAVMQVNASRWAIFAKNASPIAKIDKGVYLEAIPRDTGEVCVTLLDAKHDAKSPLAQRCTYSQVWMASATRNPEGTAMAIAVQPTESWRELWLFYKKGNSWQINVLPPASATPNIGYAEFAGWVPGGKKMLVAKEARAENRYFRSNYSVINIDTLNVDRQHTNANDLGAFLRWQDPFWKAHSVSVRQ